MEFSPMQRTISLQLSMVLLLLSPAFASDVPKQQKGDPNDSGYVSPYLSSLDHSTKHEADDPLARQEAMRESRGGNPSFKVHMLNEAAKERLNFGQMLPGAGHHSGGPRWVNIGPTKNDYI